MLIFRSASLALFAFVVWWAMTIVSTLPQPDLFGIALGIQRGQSYPTEAIRSALDWQATRHDCRVETRRSVLLLNLRLFDIQNGDASVSPAARDRALDATRQSALALLECAPSESLGWFALYGTSIRRSGFGPEAVAELRKAYLNAPHEAWLQAIRLPPVLSAYAGLPPDLKDRAMADIDDLLVGNEVFAVASLIAGSGRAGRDLLLVRLCEAPMGQRMLIANELQRMGAVIQHRCLPDLSRPLHLQ